MRRHAALLAAFALACGGTTTEPLGNLSGPVALATVQTSRPAEDERTLLFIANGDGDELRVYAPDKSPRLFLRGPNAISPLSIPLSVTDGDGATSGFRPEKLAGGTLSSGQGYVAVAGGAPGIVVVDASMDPRSVYVTGAPNLTS